MPEEFTPDPNQEQSGEEQTPDRPEWLPEKFESVEAFAESYSNLERKLTEQGQEKNNLEYQLEDLYGRLQAVEAETRESRKPAYDPSTDPTLLAYEQAMEQGDYRAALAISTNVAKANLMREQQGRQQNAEPQKDYEAWAFMAEQSAIQAVGSPEEWGQYKERVAEEAANENFEGLSATQAGQKLARLYKMVKAEDVLSNHQTMAQRQAENDRLAKIQAQGLTGSAGRPQEPTVDEAAADRIIKAAREGSYESLIGG